MKRKNNKIGQPLILVSYAIVLLIILSIFKRPTNLFGALRKVDVFSEIRKPLPKLKPIMAMTKGASALPKNVPLPKDSTLIADYAYDSANSLKYFYQKLDSAKLGLRKVRIAYFGDSFIEGDEVTDEIRLQLQKLFGGNGIGFMPMQSAVSELYSQIKIKGTGWIDYNFRENSNKYPLGLSGHLFYSEGNAEVEYIPKTTLPIGQVKLYTGKIATPNAIIYTTINGASEAVALNNSNSINETVLNTATPIKSIKVTATNERIPVYGISLEDKTGVYLDNYSFRGNTSIETLQVSREVMSQLNKYLHYDLVVIHYGINAVEHDKQRFEWFENSMHSLIQNVKKGFGNTPILLVSTSDIGHKYDGKYLTEKAVPYMVATQEELAIKYKVAFWNLFESMGGENTMVDWVEGDTVFANKDYTHVNEKGAKKVGNLFFNKLIASKNYYQNPTLPQK